LQYS